MTEVAIIEKPDLEGKRLSFALAEDRVAHYPEFRAFFARTFDLENKGLANGVSFVPRRGSPMRSSSSVEAANPFRQVLKSMPSSMRSNRSMGPPWIAIFGRSCAG
jgi:hypothetical protein